MRIDAKGIHYRELNGMVRAAIARGEKDFVLENVCGQRYIACGLKTDVRIRVGGVPGNDMCAFMSGPSVTVSGNAQDGVGNTMSDGKVVIDGSAGDVVGYGMRGGKIFIKGNAGYRVGIHMKSYKQHTPVIIIGGRAKDFLGEYMAGGVCIVLGMTPGESFAGGDSGGGNHSPVSNFVGTGMHGGAIYVRGSVDPRQLGKEVSELPVKKQDEKELETLLSEYAGDFDMDAGQILEAEFTKLAPTSSRPYGKIYAY